MDSFADPFVWYLIALIGVGVGLMLFTRALYRASEAERKTRIAAETTRDERENTA